jgi:hypothetical protein
MSIIPDDQSPAQYIGKILGNILAHIALSYWLLLTLNTFLDKDYPYDFIHIFASYFIVMNLHALVKKK